MSDTKIAYRYAEALLQKATELNKLGKIAVDMALLNDTCAANGELCGVLKNPVISSRQKLNALNAIFKSFDELSAGLLSVVADKKREPEIPEIAKAFISLYNKKRGIQVVSVTSAVALDSATEESIKGYIKDKTGATEVQITKTVNPDIIGGLVIRFGDNLLDSSISTQLKKLKKELNIA